MQKSRGSNVSGDWEKRATVEDKGVGKKRDVSHTYKECLRCVGILMTAPFV